MRYCLSALEKRCVYLLSLKRNQFSGSIAFRNRKPTNKFSMLWMIYNLWICLYICPIPVLSYKPGPFHGQQNLPSFRCFRPSLPFLLVYAQSALN